MTNENADRYKREFQARCLTFYVPLPRCLECGLVDANGFHLAGCPILEQEERRWHEHFEEQDRRWREEAEQEDR